MDNPSEDCTGRTPTHIVGIGASAGGLEAIESLFKAMPPDSGLAFVVVQHLSPDYNSMMQDLIRKYTVMNVYMATENQPVEANCIYLIPPNNNLVIKEGRLHLLGRRERAEGINLPIDMFFESLAVDCKDRGIGIVLSGTGSDGTRGLRTIKEELGMIMAQDVDTAAFDGMPGSAIATGLCDFVLAPDEMPERLIAYVAHPYASRELNAESTIIPETEIGKVFKLIKDRVKVDFSDYKPTTIMRRIERRMTVNQLQSLDDYVVYLRANPQEVKTLYQDLLIGVTRFFRDREAFESLYEYIIEIMRRKCAEALPQFRIWVPACSTGEEAYTIAILCEEAKADLGADIEIKIFATDVDQNAVNTASIGNYPDSIAADVPQTLLSKYFTPYKNAFVISKHIRQHIVFAQHNVTVDPPFTNIDLVSCRNLLIYLNNRLQTRVLEAFNFSLRSQGALVLGSSETTGGMTEYFDAVDPRNRIYRSKGRKKAVDFAGAGRSGYTLGKTGSMVREVRQNMYERDEKILERLLGALSDDLLPISIVVNESLEIVHVLGDTQLLLRFPGGKPVNELGKILHKDLSIPATTAVQKVFRDKKEVQYVNIRVDTGLEARSVRMRVRPMPTGKSQELLVVVLIEYVDSEKDIASISTDQIDMDDLARQRIVDLQQDLQVTRENLQATVEELETSNEELQATNEELLASNEELQSTNEELHSVNEELYTVNSEYQSKISELLESNNDLDNLINATAAGTIFLDKDLAIRRFTPSIQDIFDIIEHDVGRPLSNLSHNLDVNLNQVLTDALSSRSTVETEVSLMQSGEERVFQLRVRPYMISPAHESGVVVTFTDITGIAKLERAGRQRLSVLETIIDDISEGLLKIRRDGTILTLNSIAAQLMGVDKNEGQAHNVFDCIPDLKGLVSAAIDSESKVEQEMRLRVDGDEVSVRACVICDAVSDEDDISLNVILRSS